MNSDIAVCVRGLSKSYTIVHGQEKYITLAETMLSRLKNPMRWPKTETFCLVSDVPVKGVNPNRASIAGT